MKKMIKKGFTLTELIVVMAIFSIIMLAVMSLIDPVSKIYRNTAVAERTYANANSIQTYLQTHLEYAESMVVATSSNIDALGTKDGNITPDELQTVLNDYGQSHFSYIIAGTSKGSSGSDLETLDKVCYVKGRIHVLRLINNGPNRGQILHSEYPFVTNDSSDNGFTLVDPDDVEGAFDLNPVFFTGRDARYNYSYALGASQFVNVPVPTGGDPDSTYKALDLDFNYNPEAPDDAENNGTGISQHTLALTIVIDKGGKDNKGSIDVIDEDNGNNNYRAFRCPATIQASPVSLTSMNARTDPNIGVARPYKKISEDKIEYQSTRPQFGWSFRTSLSELNGEKKLADKDVKFSDDIYFFYVNTDELEADTDNEVA